MLKETTETIAGIEYKFRQLPARQAARLAYRVGKAIGPAAGALAKNPSGFSEALNALFASLPEAEFLSLLDDLLTNVQRGDVVVKREMIDIVYAGNGAEMLEAAIAHARFQLSDFFAPLAAMLPSAAAATARGDH